MNWLKEILEKAEVDKDGKLNIEAVMTNIKSEFSKHAVPKNEFNDKVAELKAANDTIKELKKTNEGNEQLQKKVNDYETEIKDLKKTAADTARSYELKEQLSKAGVLDPDYLIYKAGGLEKFTFDKENHPVGVDEVVKPYKEDTTMAHLFKQEPKGQLYNPQSGANNSTMNPFAKETFNLTKQGELLKSNPEQAREMASAAGITI